MIKSLLDTDLYKLTMMQVVFEKYTNVNVKYAFKSRKQNVYDWIKNTPLFFIEVCNAIDELCQLKFTEDELNYLQSIRFFKPNFIEYLRLFQLNKNYVTIGGVDDLSITIEGPWISTIMFEVPILAIISELYHKHCEHIDKNNVGQNKLMSKINLVREMIPKELLYKFRIVDLGTRRRFSFDNQEMVIKTMTIHNSLSSTSNIYFAKKYGIKAAGTMAHEYICAHQQLVRVVDSQKAAFQAWADVYRGDLGIALSDTVGFDAFLRDFDLYFAKLFDGARHDSGNPFDWCIKLINHYKKLGIDPLTKIAVFSDGLNFNLMIELFENFNDQINTSFGIGTNLTNDCGFKPLQIVMKMVECNGRPVAKISDSNGKAMCMDQQYEDYVRSIFKGGDY